MSEVAPQGIAGSHAADPANGALADSEIESILADFRAWLQDAPKSSALNDATDEIDLYTLVAQFTALRHEVNLQTRTARAQLELNTQALEQLRLLKREEPGCTEPELSSESDARPFIQSLIEAADVQLLAVRELGRVVETVSRILQGLEQISSMPSPEPLNFGWFARLCGASKIVRYQHDLASYLEECRTTSQGNVSLLETILKPMEASLAGLKMGLQRLDRALERHGVAAIPSSGRQFDPEQMEVLEAVADSGRSPGEVIEELRRGYLWNGRVFRYAQVRVAR